MIPSDINKSLPKPKLGDSPWVACECGNHTFDEVFSFKHVSAILSPDGQEHDVPISLFECRRCGRVPGFVRKQVPFEMFSDMDQSLPCEKCGKAAVNNEGDWCDECLQQQKR